MRPSLLLVSSLALVLTQSPLGLAEDVTDPATGLPVVIEAPAQASLLGDYLAGMQAAYSGDYGAAADHLLRVIAADPTAGNMRTYVFTLAASTGRFAEADLLAEAILLDDPTQGAAHLNLAVALAVEADWEKAQAHIDALETDGIGRLVRPFLSAWITLATGDLAAATAQLPSDSDDSFGSLTALHRALLADVAGDVTAAASGYAAALSNRDLRTPRMILLAGNFYERQGQTADAKALYQEALDAQGGENALMEAALSRLESNQSARPIIGTVQEGMAELLFEIGQALVSEEQSESALFQLQMALRLRPDFDFAWLTVAEINRGLQQRDVALAAYEKVQSDSLISWPLRLSRAELLQEMARLEEAAALYETLAAERPTSLEPLYRLGNLLRIEAKFTEAANAYDRAIERMGKPEAADWPFFYFRGICLERLDQWDKAERDFLLALDLESEQPQVMNYLAYSWVTQGLHLERALKMLERAVELRPTDGFIVDSLGWALYTLKDFEGAIAHLERAVALSPTNAVINDHLGDAYWQVGRLREAKVQWRRALSFLPDPELEAATVEQKLIEGLPAGE